MAHVSKYKLKNGEVRYRSHVHRFGQSLTQAGFKYRKDAQRWGDEQDRSIQLTNLPLTVRELMKYTAEDVLRRYRDEVVPHKINEVTLINKFLRYRICKKPLSSLKSSDVWDYIRERQKETWRGKPIKNSSIRRDLNTISRAFVIARKKWKDFENLTNPFVKLGDELPNADNRRERRLKVGEENKLWEACKGCLGLNRYYVPLAIALAIHTGMRLQEIFNLTWEDVDFERRRIVIRKSKTDHVSGGFKGRTIVLPIRAEYFLSQLAIALSGERRLVPTDRIFPMTSGAFKQSWADVRKRAGIKDLTFHDLRHEAGSRFAEGKWYLSKPQHDRMMGHNNRDMSSRYIHAELMEIQEKLDRQALGGKTFEEWWPETAKANLKLPEGAKTFETYEAFMAAIQKQTDAKVIHLKKSKAS
jgi:integrase